MSEEKNTATEVNEEYQSNVEASMGFIERFDILETINNVGNDEVFTPVRTCQNILDMLPDEVWHNPNYKWLNPCDKNGVFLREIALRLDKGLANVEGYTDQETRRKHILTEMLYSIGLTEFTSLVSRRTVYYCVEANRHTDGDVAEDGHSYRGFAIGNGSWFASSEGNILKPTSQHKFVNGRCKYCGISQSSRYVDPSQNEHYSYDFIHRDPGLDLELDLQKKFKGDKNMKFNIIIGNPPYQLSDGGGTGSSAISIYQLFVKNAISLDPDYISFIIPSRWMTGGKGLDDFRDKMIHDKHISILHDYPNSADCFSNVGIEGGVCYFLWDKNHHGMCDIYRHESGGQITKSTRYLVESGDDIFIRSCELLQIRNKVSSYNERSFEDIVSSRLPYGLGSDFFKKNESILSKRPIPDTDCYTILGFNEEIRYIPKSYPIKGTSSLHKYKVFISKARGGSALGANESTQVLTAPILGYPDEICTETYLEIGPFDTQEEAENCISYIKTKFFRCLVGIRKQTQNAPKGVYRYVPLIDLTKKWTDDDLYKKYNLSEDDIEYIEKNIEEMS